jgi:DNA polymerase III alpha subunit
MDCFGLNRATMKQMVPELLDKCQSYHEKRLKLEINPATKLKPPPSEILEMIKAYNLDDEDILEPMDLEQCLQAEVEATGCYLTESPFAPFTKVIDEFTDCTIGELMGTAGAGDDDDDIGPIHFQGEKRFAAILTRYNETIVKNDSSKGKPMAFMTLAGTNGQCEAMAIADTWGELLKLPGGWRRARFILWWQGYYSWRLLCRWLLGCGGW